MMHSSVTGQSERFWYLKIKYLSHFAVNLFKPFAVECYALLYVLYAISDSVTQSD